MVSAAAILIASAATAFAQNTPAPPAAPPPDNSQGAAPPPGSAPPPDNAQAPAPGDNSQAAAPPPGSAPDAPASDPPSVVGRLSDVEGTVSFHTGDQSDWSPATLNYPITTGSSLWTEPSARTEVQIGGAELRMDQGTWVDVTELDDNATQVRVNQGVVNIHVLAMPPGGVSVLTPLGQVDLTQPGSYDINAGAPDGSNPPSQAVVSVLQGAAAYEGPQGNVALQAGEAATLSGNPVNVAMGQAAPSPFDAWANEREQRAAAAAAQSAHYVPAGIVGAQDLAANGTWAQTPDYGAVWYPSAVPAGWAPYQFGHWAFVAPWGWTWIDDAPWGFAPFHYGRWAQIDGRWGWAPVVPGVEVVARPVYAPAMVAFIGGGGFGVTLAVGGAMAAVGWVALAPFEPFHPWYHTSPAYVREVNIVNVNRTTINNITVVQNNVTINNFHNGGHTVVVPAQSFTHAGPVQRSVVVVPHEQLAAVHVAGPAAMGEFHPTADARTGFAHPNAVPEGIRPGVQVAVSRQPVAYHEQAVLPHTGPAPAAPHVPGPAFHPAAVTSAPRPGAPGAHPGAPQAVRPAAVAPAPRPPGAPEPAHPAAAAPAPRPPGAPEPAHPAAAAPAPRPPGAAEPARPAAAAPAPRPPGAAEPAHPAAAAPAPRPPGAAEPARPAAAAPAPRPAGAPAPAQGAAAHPPQPPKPQATQAKPAAAPAPKPQPKPQQAAAPKPQAKPQQAAPKPAAKPPAKAPSKEEEKKDDKKD
jgi:hypothetical protein